MPAVVADVLRVALAVGHEADPVRPEKAPQGMTDLPFAGGVFQEAVAAVAGVLDEALPRGDRRHAMAEQPAGISHLLGEARAIGESIGALGEHQRMAAAHADVLMNPSSIGEAHVGVMPEEARQRVSDVRAPPVLGQVLDAAPAMPGRA